MSFTTIIFYHVGKRRMRHAVEIYRKTEWSRASWKRKFFSATWVLEWFFLFCFSENDFFTSYVACYFICSSRKTFKQSFTDVLNTGVRKYSAIFTGQRLCWSLFLIKFQDWRPAFLFKSDSNTGVFLRILRNF